MNNRKMLPIYHISRGYLPTTDILLMLLGQDLEGYGAYIFEVYMNTIAKNKSLYPVDLDYENITCIEHHIYNSSGARNLITCEYTEFLINNIERNLYIVCTIDVFYISNYNSYHKEHREQNLFIYGYNTDTKTFYASDYFLNNKYRGYGCVRFEELSNSLVVNDKLSFIKQTSLIGLISNKKREINIPLLYHNFKRFIKSEPIYPIQNVVFGYTALELGLEWIISDDYHTYCDSLFYHYDMFLKCIKNIPEVHKLLSYNEVNYLKEFLNNKNLTYHQIKQSLKSYKLLIEKLLI